jgi:GNAT superfamily N-acetyltransferase
MNISTRDQRKVKLIRYSSKFRLKLLAYLEGLSPETRSRFGPHPFTPEGIDEVFITKHAVQGFIAIDAHTDEVVAYMLLKAGFLEADGIRYKEYSVQIPETGICTYAPSVADQWQNSGLGSMMLEYILDEIRSSGFKTMILWGGVQASNTRAVSYYLKHGFVEVGWFFHHGENIDMIRHL